MTTKIKISMAISAVGLVVLLGLLLSGLTQQDRVRPAGQIDVGGPFQLITVTGDTVSEADFAGRPMLMFFGFTYCPDVCPTTLDRLGLALGIIEEQAPEIYAALQPVFISVDPARDTPAQMADYLSYFHPKIIGLTGSEAQITAVKKAYRVYAAKRPEVDANGNYNVDHSSFFYLMDGENRYLAHYDDTLTAEQLAAKLMAKLR